MGLKTPSPPARRLHCRDLHGRRAMTLVEVMVGCTMICITCTTFMFIFTQLNQMAMVSRLYTGAYAVAQSQIDLISTDSPFQPGATTPLVPTELTPGPPMVTPVTVYQDPVSNNTVTGTMTTTVTAANSSFTSGSTTETLYLYEATVTVSYTYRNHNYSVSFSTLRTSDV